MQESVRWIERDRLGVLTGTLVLTLALSRLLENPTRSFFTTTIFGSPLGFTLSTTTLIQLILLGLTTSGMSSLILVHPAATTTPQHRMMFWIVPGLAGMGLVGWLNHLDGVGEWVLALLVCLLLLPCLLTVEYNAVDPVTRRTPFLQWAQMMFVHLTAVLLFTLLYQARLRSLLSGSAVLLVTTLLATRLFWAQQDNIPQAIKQGLVVGFSMGQLMWLLNYGQLSNLQGGVSLLLAFYLLTGFIQQAVNKQLDDGRNGRRILLEYGGVAIVALLILVLVVP